MNHKTDQTLVEATLAGDHPESDPKGNFSDLETVIMWRWTGS